MPAPDSVFKNLRFDLAAIAFALLLKSFGSNNSTDAVNYYTHEEVWKWFQIEEEEHNTRASATIIPPIEVFKDIFYSRVVRALIHENYHGLIQISLQGKFWKVHFPKQMHSHKSSTRAMFMRSITDTSNRFLGLLEQRAQQLSNRKQPVKCLSAENRESNSEKLSPYTHSLTENELRTPPAGFECIQLNLLDCDPIQKREYTDLPQTESYDLQEAHSKQLDQLTKKVRSLQYSNRKVRKYSETTTNPPGSISQENPSARPEKVLRSG
jgi:hypothetical protein